MTEETISIYCPHCHKHTSVRMGVTPIQTDHGHINIDTVSRDRWGKKHWLGFCNACNGVILVADSGARIYPFPLPTPTDIRIPEDLRKDLDESKMCFSVDCYRACSVLARRSIQQACILKGAKQEKLVDQINELADAKIITGDIAEWATLIQTH